MNEDIRGEEGYWDWLYEQWKDSELPSEDSVYAGMSNALSPLRNVERESCRDINTQSI